MAPGRPQPRPTTRRRVAGERARSRDGSDAPKTPESSPSTVEDLASARDDGGRESQTGATLLPERAVDADIARGDETHEPAEPDRPMVSRSTEDSDAGRPPRRAPRWLTLVSAALVVLFLATAGILGWRLYEGHAREVSRNDVLGIVPSYTVKIFSFDYRHLDQDADGARPLLVGSYRSDYDKSMKRNSASYRKYHYVVKSSVASAAVSDASADRVRVVAFVDQTVTAGAQKPGTGREQTRLGLTFERHGGKWLLAKVESI